MFKSSIGTMIITMISRILGLLRGSLIAYYFGSSYVTDAYFSAFKISNFFVNCWERELWEILLFPYTIKNVNRKERKKEGTTFFPY